MSDEVGAVLRGTIPTVHAVQFYANRYRVYPSPRTLCGLGLEPWESAVEQTTETVTCRTCLRIVERLPDHMRDATKMVQP